MNPWNGPADILKDRPVAPDSIDVRAYAEKSGLGMLDAKRALQETYETECREWLLEAVRWLLRKELER